MGPGINIPVAVVADDHVRMLDKISEILDGEVTIVAKVYDGEASVRAVTQYEPDLLVLDVVMPCLSGIEAAREIRRRGLACKIIFLSIHDGPEFLREAQKLDASYVSKQKINKELVSAIRNELKGMHFYSSL